MSKTKHICTLSDYHYFNYGMALYNSLMENSDKNFILYYLCLDDSTHEEVVSKGYRNIKAIHLNELTSTEKFDELKRNTEYKPLSSENTYCWALASFFSEYLVSKLEVPHVVYIDADIMFYNNIQDIWDVMFDRSVGIMLHRHNDVGCYVGGYNVGMIGFKNDDPGRKCLTWWRDCVINPSNEWATEYGTCGDQKYLEAFPLLFGKENISVIDETIGHGAPWNMGLYQYVDQSLGGEFVWAPYDHKGNKLNLGLDFNTKRQKMYFVHYSQFTPEYGKGAFNFDRNGAWRECNIYNNKNAILYYIDIFTKTKACLIN